MISDKTKLALIKAVSNMTTLELIDAVEAECKLAQSERKPLTDEHPLMVFAKECVLGAYQETELADAAQRAIKAANGIKE